MLTPDGVGAGRGGSGRPELGFTLMELLISITLLGIVMASLAGVMIATLGTNRNTETAISESNDLQLASSFFADDAAGALTFATSGPPQCGTGSFIVELRGQVFDTSSLAPQSRVTTYVLRSGTAGGVATRTLHRVVCQGSAVPVGDTTVARLLSMTVTPAVTCKTVTGSATSCAGTAATTVIVPLTSRSGDVQMSLTGHRRTS